MYRVDPEIRRSLSGNGAIFASDQVIERVDDRIVAGFRAQIEDDEQVPPEQRQRVLLSMLQDYYQMR